MFQPDDTGFSVKLPFGLTDIFPFEANERNSIKGIISREFKLWGYGEVKTPPVEFTSNMSLGVGKDWKNKLINFFDIDGSLVSLRTDMTVPIARLTGMRIKKDQLPIRFCYFADSFRQTGMQKGIKRIYNQAGLELIGSFNSIKADTEILIILMSLLEELKVGQFKIGLGHIKIIEGLCEWFGLDGRGTDYIKKEIAAKNLVAVSNFLIGLDKKKAKLFIKLLQPEEDREKTRDLISVVNRKKVIDGFNYLNEVIEILGKMDYSKNVITDFSIIRDFDYYTGLLFEVYSSRITRIIGSGGRYEGLIKKFGLDVAGTAQMTGFKLPTGAASGRVLTSDASGVGSWQAGGTLSCARYTHLDYVSAGVDYTYTHSCPAGMYVTGGGAWPTSFGGETYIYDYPASSDAWTCIYKHDSANNWVGCYIICCETT